MGDQRKTSLVLWMEAKSNGSAVQSMWFLTGLVDWKWWRKKPLCASHIFWTLHKLCVKYLVDETEPTLYKSGYWSTEAALASLQSVYLIELCSSCMLTHALVMRTVVMLDATVTATYVTTFVSTNFSVFSSLPVLQMTLISWKWRTNRYRQQEAWQSNKVCMKMVTIDIKLRCLWLVYTYKQIDKLPYIWLSQLSTLYGFIYYLPLSSPIWMYMLVVNSLHLL